MSLARIKKPMARINDYINQIICGDCREILKQMPDESVQCVITSPPYWGLRDYGLEPLIWGDNNCEHVWGNMQGQITTAWKEEIGQKGDTLGDPEKRKEKRYSKEPCQGQFCQLCGAWRGSLGLEPSPELYVEHLVEICRGIKRVLRKDGTFWLVMGDSYASGKGTCFNPGGGEKSYIQEKERYPLDRGNVSTLRASGLKPKNLCEIPSDVARALRADGWWLRSRLPWLKRNSMPGSEKDRPTGSGSTVEYVFFLTKSKSYFYDNEAVKMPLRDCSIERAQYAWHGQVVDNKKLRSSPDPTDKMGSRWAPVSGRERRPSDWFFESWQGFYEEDGDPLAFIVNPVSYKEAHFATFPTGLIKPMILAGTSEYGCCSKCGAPWERIVEKGEKTVCDGRKSPRLKSREIRYGSCETIDGVRQTASDMIIPKKTLGWQPTCKCDAEIEPCIVVDPCIGSGTTAVVAMKLARNFIGIDLSPEYCAMAEKRLKPLREQMRLI